MEYYYIGVEGSIACTRICAIKLTKELNEPDEGYRHWHVAAGTDLQMIPIDKNAESIADGIQKLMQKVTKTENWRSAAIISKIIVVFPQEQDHSMLEFERFFTEKFIANDQGISKKFEVLPEIDLVIKTHFELYDDGIALQSGTESFCKKKVKNSSEIMFLDAIPEASEAGGAYWLARTALQMVIREIETVEGPKKLDFVRQIFQKEIFPGMEVFEMNEMLFTKKMKHRLARVTEVLAIRPFEMENAWQKRVREQAWKVMAAMKKRALAEQAKAADNGEAKDPEDQRPNITPSLKIDEGDLSFFMDFKEEIVHRMAESDEAKAIIEARFAENDLITSLFEKAGEHLGNLITRTLSAQPRPQIVPPSKHRRDDSDASTSGVETGSDGDSERSRSPPESTTPKATRTPVPTTPVRHPSSPAMPTTPTPLSVHMAAQMSAPMPPTPFKDLKPVLQEHGAETLKVVLFGRMFDSYGLLESGLLDGISKSSYNNVALYRKREVSAAAAAVMAAHDDGCFIEMTPAELLDVASFGKDRKEFKKMSRKEQTEEVKKSARR